MLCVCVAALGLSIWQLSDIFLEYKAGTDEYDDLQQYVMAEVPEDGEGTGDAGTEETGEDGTEEERVQRVALSELQAQNSDTVGWIEIPGTGISYPLMQTGDDSLLSESYLQQEDKQCRKHLCRDAEQRGFHRSAYHYLRT